VRGYNLGVYRFPEDQLLDRIAAALPDSGYEGRTQFTAMLPMAAIFSGVLSLGFVGFGALSFAIAALQAMAPFAILQVLLLFGPPILWIASFFLLQKRCRSGWRLFAIAGVLAVLQALLSFNIFSLAFDALFVYAATQTYNAYRY
jgi:hypothetical protein